MKLLWLIALIFAFIGNFGESAPPNREIKQEEEQDDVHRPLKKKVSFSAGEEVFEIPSDPTGVFWLNKKSYAQRVQQKETHYDASSSEYRFLAALAGVINDNREMFEVIWIHALVAKKISDDLCQLEMNTEKGVPRETTDEDQTKLVPSTEDVVYVELHKTSFEIQLDLILKSLFPSYRNVEHLYGLLDCMTEKTKINPDVLEPLLARAQIVHEIKRYFTSVYDKRQFRAFEDNIRDIRKITNHLEDGAISETAAENKLIEYFFDIDELVPDIQETLDDVRKINFKLLTLATNDFYTLAYKALNP